MKARYLCLLLLFISGTLVAQREMANWYFGFNAGLDFNSGNPLPQNDSAISTIECSSVMSDTSGDLLFYTNGERIFNSDFNTMVNGDGILGHKSSTTGAIIVPDPGNSNRYYVFTSDAVQFYQEDQTMPTGKGLNYSIVDMSLNGGLGEVTQKNINILSETSEKLTAVSRGDGLGYWILTHHIDSFYAFSITNTGITPAVISTIGPSIQDYNNFRGWIKLSPDGSKLAVAHSIFEPFLTGSLLLYDFDNLTGQVTNETLLGEDSVYYGVEFSSNSERLYVSEKLPLPGGFVTGNIQLSQYDVLAANISSTEYLITEIESDALSDVAGALQIGIDCKVYYTNANSEISVIARPNRNNELAEFRFGAVNLGSGSGSLGLPGCVQSYFDNIIEYDDLCFGDQIQFTLNTSRSIDNVQWNFGDPTSGNNTSTLMSPSHQYSTPDSYVATALVTFSDGEVRDYQKILDIIDAPSLQGTTLRQCDTDGVDDGLSFFNLEESISNILDDDLENIAQVTFFETESDAILGENQINNVLFYPNQSNGQVIYANVNATLDCSVIVPVVLQVQANSIPPDRERDICGIVGSQEDVALVVIEILEELDQDYPGLNIALYQNLDDAISETNDLEGSPIDSLNNLEGIYYRVENDTGCVAVGFYILNVLEAPEIFNSTVVLCDTSDGVELSFETGFDAYEWETGETTPSIIAFEPGPYTVTVFNAAGCFDIATFTVEEAPQFDIEILVNDFQQSNSITVSIDTQVDNVFYSLDNGFTFQESPIFDNLAPGYYNLIVKDGVGCNEINTIVLVRGAPRLFTPNGDGINDFWHVKEKENYPGMKITIMDRFGKRITSFTNLSQGWDGTFNGREMPSNAYWYRIDYEGANYYGHFSLIRRGG